jgi:putative membrane protein
MTELVSGAWPLLAQIGHHMDWGTSGWAWLWMTLMMVGGAVLLVVLVYVLIRGSQGGQEPSAGKHPVESPLEIAKRRYASGEITEEEFMRIKEHMKA